MTTAAQVKKLLQPLLERNQDLVWVGRQIYLKPVNHFARTVLIERLLDPDGFRPQWAVVHLFQSRKHFPLSWGEWLQKRSGEMQGSWRIYDPGVSGQLIEAIEQHALPILRSMQTFDQYLTYVSDNPFRHQLYDWPTVKIIVDVALGDLDAARLICGEHLESWMTDKPHYGENDRAEFRRLRELCIRLKQDDRPGLARLLHAWEAETVKNFKIEHIWEPTPFPLELQPPT
jgi:hypothetical protein